MIPDAEGYDALAKSYHLIFENWESSIQRQAAALTEILREQCRIVPPSRILDCACGIGTQCLGLAQQGFQLTASDLSPAAVARARNEALARGLTIRFANADMLDLGVVDGENFDGVICMDNSLPHLCGEYQLLAAMRQVSGKLRPGGVFLASTRDYNLLLRERPVTQGPFFYSDDGKRRIVFQVWEWIDQRRYRFHLYITREVAGGWETDHASAEYRGFLREEFTEILCQTGFCRARWLMPHESQYYQPLVIAFAR
jgi:SAM-dependent methyltransferase